jgi:hypothetical protein
MTTLDKTLAQLRSPIEPAHGVWELHRRYSDALALMIEQQAQILVELQQINKPAGK